MLSTREAYGEALAYWGDNYDFYVLDADLSKATQTIKFAEKFPERFIDFGIAEANMLSFSAGLSLSGTPVFASTFAAFAAGRGYDQVRNSIAYAKCNVKIGATHGGVLIGADGGTHQCIEDIALMRAIPGMVVLCPSDPSQVKGCIKAALEYDGPVYLRFGRLPCPDVYNGSEDFEFTIGKGYVVRKGNDVTIAAIGDMVSKALAAADALSKGGIDARVIDMATIKPIDKALIEQCARETGCFVTAEDHNILGGLGGAVCEALARDIPCPVEMVGLGDVFGTSGEPSSLAAHFEIDEAAIEAAVKKVISRKERLK